MCNDVTTNWYTSTNNVDKDSLKVTIGTVSFCQLSAIAFFTKCVVVPIGIVKNRV